MLVLGNMECVDYCFGKAGLGRMFCAKGFFYDTEYNWKVLPANNGNIEYDKYPKPDADSQLDFKVI